MPAKNTIKVFTENGYYHIYNRGVDKRIIYQTKKDYQVFLNIIKTALSPPLDPKLLSTPFTLKGSSFKGIPYQPKNFSDTIELLSFCLMPNHFHLLLYQQPKDAISSFMRSTITRYSMYFNKKYSRTGTLFQGIYKSVPVISDEQLTHLSRYIHQNPTSIHQNSLDTYPYSSLKYYYQTNPPVWIKPKRILNHFSQNDTYRHFITTINNKSIKSLTLEASNL